MTKTIPEYTTREHLLEVGYKLIAHKGFASVGLTELLRTAEVPKGSFYHYFASKAQFGEILIQEYFQRYYEILDEVFEQEGKCARDRLLDYWKLWQQTQSAKSMERRCLVVKLSAEVSGLSEPMRLALLQGCEQVIARIAQCIEDGKKDGSIAQAFNADQGARTLYYLWLGACLVNTLAKNDIPLQEAMVQTLEFLAG